MPPVCWIILAVLAMLLVLLAAAGFFFISFSLKRKGASAQKATPKPETAEEADSVMAQNEKRIAARAQQWASACRRQPVQIRSFDGLTLRGELFEGAADCHVYVIEVHGYTCTHMDMVTGAVFYAEKGYHVLMPDLRAHGESEGKYIGMGWPDRKDMLGWIDWIVQRDPAAQIILSGVSMGSATVMMTAGEKLPANVKAVVADCGYTSVWDEMGHELKQLFHLPAFPLLYVTSWLNRLVAGYSFREASAIDQIRRCTVPVFFAHGSQDNFVPTAMVYRLYDACPTKKELFVVEGAGHANSLFMAPEEYGKRLFAFLDEALAET